LIPFAVIRDRSFSILEAVILFLKKNKGLTNREIAILLNRSEKTTWTVYKRAEQKAFSRTKSKTESKTDSRTDSRTVSKKEYSRKGGDSNE